MTDELDKKNKLVENLIRLEELKNKNKKQQSDEFNEFDEFDEFEEEEEENNLFNWNNIFFGTLIIGGSYYIYRNATSST